MTLAVQHVAVGFAQRVRDQFVAHEAPVHVHELSVTRGPRIGRRADEAVEPYGAAVCFDRTHRLSELRSERHFDSLGRTRRREARHDATVVPQGEVDIRVRQGRAGKRVLAVSEFRGIAFQEFAPRGGVVVKIVDLDRRSKWVRGRLNRADAPAFCAERKGAAGACSPARKRDPCNRSDACERLAAKAQRANLFEIVQGSDLARCVARERHRQILALNAGSVVDDTDLLYAAFDERDADVGGARIEAVLEELLQYRRRPVDHFPRRDLADERFGQRADGGHVCSKGSRLNGARASVSNRPAAQIICRGRMPRWTSFSPAGICSSISTGTLQYCFSNTAPGSICCSSPSFFARPGWS